MQCNTEKKPLKLQLPPGYVHCAHLHGDGLHPLDELLRDLVRGHRAVLHQHEPARAAADGDAGVPPHLHTYRFTIVWFSANIIEKQICDMRSSACISNDWVLCKPYHEIVLSSAAPYPGHGGVAGELDADPGPALVDAEHEPVVQDPLLLVHAADAQGQAPVLALPIVDEGEGLPPAMIC